MLRHFLIFLYDEESSFNNDERFLHQILSSYRVIKTRHDETFSDSATTAIVFEWQPCQKYKGKWLLSKEKRAELNRQETESTIGIVICQFTSIMIPNFSSHIACFDIMISRKQKWKTTWLQNLTRCRSFESKLYELYRVGSKSDTFGNSWFKVWRIEKHSIKNLFLFNFFFEVCFSSIFFLQNQHLQESTKFSTRRFCGARWTQEMSFSKAKSSIKFDFL